MAASDRILAVVVEAVAKLKKRLDAVETLSPIAGIDGRDGVDGATGPTGPQGEQGPAGPKGEAGETGETGPRGERGEKGDTGAAGQDGNNGVSVATARVEGDELFIALDSGDVLRAGNVRGPKGDTGEPGERGADGASGSNGSNGADGRGIQSADLDGAGHLVLTLSDGEEIDVGRVVGKDGKDGITQTVFRAGGQKQQTQSTQISDGRFFEIDVSGLRFEIDVSEFGLSRVRNFNVRNHDGFDVSVVSRMSGSVFELSSNVSLDGHKLFLE